MKRITVEMPYIGSCLSNNHYKGRRRDGGEFVRKETREWMQDLGWLIKTSHIEAWHLPLQVRCDARFDYYADKRRVCDISNFCKVVLDAIEEVSGVNDRSMRWQDGEVSYGEPALLTITITEAENE